MTLFSYFTCYFVYAAIFCSLHKLSVIFTRHNFARCWNENACNTELLYFADGGQCGNHKSAGTSASGD